MKGTKKLKQAPREGAGRPKTIPSDARTRSIRLTQTEYDAVTKFVKELRAESRGK